MAEAIHQDNEDSTAFESSNLKVSRVDFQGLRILANAFPSPLSHCN